MRHGKKFNHLGRKSQHRKAMLANMASSLIKHKRITTTLAKAKALRKYVEPLITKSKDDSTHQRRVVFSYLQDKYAVTELFNEVAAKIATRPGGYTRILRTGFRQGDHAEMCMIELVDFNETYTREPKESTEKKRRTRRGGSKAKEAAPAIDELDTATDEATDIETEETEAAAEVAEQTQEAATEPEADEPIAEVAEAEEPEAVVETEIPESIEDVAEAAEEQQPREEKTAEAVTEEKEPETEAIAEQPEEKADEEESTEETKAEPEAKKEEEETEEDEDTEKKE